MKTSLFITSIAGLILFVLSTSCSKDSFRPEFHYQNIHDLVTETVSAQNIPGMIAAIADSSGLILIESAGVRKVGSSEQITINDHFHIGSCCKAITSALLATLVADDLIQWETTIIDVFPELKDIIHQDYHNVTLYQLVTHRAGLEKNGTNWMSFEDMEIKERRLAIIKENLKEPSRFNLGEFNYSNLGYTIAGCMAERITGLSWETLIKTRLFEPLGMTSAGFGSPGTTDQIDQPWGHIKYGNKWQPNRWDSPETIGPAGTVHCSIEDWVKFISLFLKKGNTPILERNQLNKLIEPIGNYACGWGVYECNWANGTVYTHNGTNDKWYVSLSVAPEINRAFIAGTNSFDDKTETIFDAVINNLVEINQGL